MNWAESLMASLKSASGGVFGYVAVASLEEGCEFRNIFNTRYKTTYRLPGVCVKLIVP